MRKGRLKYVNTALRKEARTMRLGGAILVLAMTILIVLIILARKTDRAFMAWLALCVALYVVFFWFLINSFSFDDMRTYENGIRLPAHRLRQFLRRRFVPFSAVSTIVLHPENRNMSVHYLDRKGQRKSATVWRMDMEKGFEEASEFLRTKAKVIEE